MPTEAFRLLLVSPTAMRASVGSIATLLVSKL